MTKDIYPEVDKHYQMVKEDNLTRQTRENGWNDIIDAYWGKLPDDWPFDSKVTIPIIRTSLTEKNARLLNGKLRGRLMPREGGDIIKAKINNALLDFQWDSANLGGSMLAKWKEMDMDTREMGSCFGLALWRHAEHKEEKKYVVDFDGNEFTVLNPLDCGIDPNCKNIKDAKWFQHRKWTTIEELETENDISVSGNLYPGLAELKKAIAYAKDHPHKQDKRDSEYEDRIRSLKGLEDRMGSDDSFPILEIVTEYRPDRWITFSPKHKVILRDIKNPYNHGKIPVVQLNYYKLQDDPWGESEVEPVLPTWRAIQAVLCAYLDTMIIHMRPPLIAVEGQYRQETIKYGAEEVWVVNNPGAISEFQGNTDSLQYFQTTFGALLSQFNMAMGDMSQGISNLDPFSSESKTATEIKATVKQQNVRDQANQNDLAEAIKDLMLMWISNNKQFLFSDPSKKDYVIRIIGSEAYAAFKKAGMDEMELPDESAQMISDIVEAQGGNVSDADLMMMIEAGSLPKFPIIENPNEKNPENFKIRPKMEIDANGNEANLTIVPEDLDGTYDYIADVKSMATTFGEEQQMSLQSTLELLTGNPVVLQLLNVEGYKPNVKDLLVQYIESRGSTDGDRYFSRIEQAAPAGTTPNGTLQQPGLPGVPPTAPQEMLGQQMAGPAVLPQQGGVLPSLPPIQG